MNTLVYHFGALGDFITMLPVIGLWKKKHDTGVTLLGKPAFGLLAQDAGYCDAILDADGSRHFFLFRDRPDEMELRRFFAPFAAIMLFTSPDSPLAAHARIFSSAQLLCQPPFPGAGCHIIDYHLSLLPPAARSPQQCIPFITPSGTHLPPLFEKVYANSRPIIALHPGSGSRRKNWPFLRFLLIAEQMRKKGCSILWITGPAETGMEIPQEDLHLENFSLSGCATVLSRCCAYIGNDSGMTHLAAASGCPVIALFGPSDPAVWCPRGRSTVTVIHHPVGCAPCHLKSDKPSRCTGECMHLISPEEVLSALKHIILLSAVESRRSAPNCGK